MSAISSAGRTRPGRMPLSAASSSFVDDIRIDFGPYALLGRFFLAADAAVQERGVRLSFAPMEQLVEINRENPESWRPLLPHYDPSYGGISEQNAFCLVGRSLGGDIVATQAARFYDFAETNLHEEASSLRLFYPDPMRMRRPGEACTITAPSAKGIRGRVAFSGAAWYRPDFRGRELSSLLPRIGRAYAHAIWNTDCTFTFIAKALVDNGAWRRAGYSNIEWDVVLRNSVMGQYHGALVWMHTQEMLENLSTDLQGAAQIDGRVQQRRAQ
jgi:hypothetical protein